MQILHYTRSNAEKKAIKSFLVVQNRFLTSHIVSGELSRIIEEQNIPHSGHLLETVAILNATGSNHDILFSHRME